jgi:tetratricopeptide (TPR) repeat protein
MTVSRPDPEEYARFLQGDLDLGGNLRIVRHLLAVWRLCRDELGPRRGGGPGPVVAPRTKPAEEYGQAFRRLVPRLEDYALRIDRERRQLPPLLSRLQALPSPEWHALVDSDEAFHNWSLGEWLIEESQRSSYADPAGAESLAGCAVVVAERLAPGIYGTPLINDLKARAWACRGEVLRLLSDLRGAVAAFESAESLIAQGTGDALEEARILELKAALCRDQRQAGEAHRLLDEIIAIYRQYRDLHLLGRAFVQKGRVYGSSNDLKEAVAWLRKGLGLIDPSRERCLHLAARHSLMLCLHEIGRSREARFLLKASRPEFLQHGSPLLILRLRWLEGKIYEALKFLKEAERALVEARQGFVDLGIGFSAAAVSLDLAGLYAAQGRATEMRSLAEEILPIFQSRDLQREAIAALLAFRQAARLETTSSQVFTEIRSYLDQVRQDPKLRLERA